MCEPLTIDWGEAKAEINLMVHGVSFGAAAAVLGDPGRLALARPGGRLRPDRTVAIGRVDGRVMAVVCDALAERRARLVSARLATPEEWKAATHDAPPPGRSVVSALAPAEAIGLDRLDAGTIRRNAVADPDNPPFTPDELGRAVFARRIRLIREGTELSTTAFAHRFALDDATLRSWEHGLAAPDRTALAYLTVIAREQAAVERALDAAPSPAA